jgi:hypothetical protein
LPIIAEVLKNQVVVWLFPHVTIQE